VRENVSHGGAEGRDDGSDSSAGCFGTVTPDAVASSARAGLSGKTRFASLSWGFARNKGREARRRPAPRQKAARPLETAPGHCPEPTLAPVGRFAV